MFENCPQFKPYDGRTEYLALLGYAYPREEADAPGKSKFTKIQECIAGDYIHIAPSAEGLMLRIE
jgi:hypothetical protein